MVCRKHVNLILEIHSWWQLKGSSSPYKSNRASPTEGRRPLHFKRDLMGLSLSLSFMVMQNGIYNLHSGFHDYMFG
jgi:hypothetical protein